MRVARRSRGPKRHDARRPAASHRGDPAPRGRTAQGWIHGIHAVNAAIANPRRSCDRLLVTDDVLAKITCLPRPGLDVDIVTRREIDRQVGADAIHQGVALSVAPLPKLDIATTCTPVSSEPSLVLALDQVTDPRNLGAILRSAAAFGARAVITPGRHSAEIGGLVAKAASGALEHVPVVEVVNLARTLDELRQLGYWTIGLDADAETTIDTLVDVTHTVLVLGAEGRGLRRLVASKCDHLVRLPISSDIESLNVSVAAGIALYVLATHTRRA